MTPENMNTETETDLTEEEELDIQDDADVPDDEPPELPGVKRPSMSKAVKAKCFDCCGDMMDGRIDCGIVKCSLYYWQPYRKGTPDLTWQTEGTHLLKNRTALRAKMKESARRQRHGGEENA